MLLEKMNSNKVIRDNIHGNISIEYKIIWDLINTDVFQRLRRVHQLGGTFIVFPCAEHSRFVHSLGVYNVMQRIINEVKDIDNYLSDREKIIALCSGLLHDIGHGPYSHAFEDVFKTNHEDMTIRMILEDTSINEVLNKYDSNIAQDIADVINKKHSNTILIQLISSQVDADRMDYLLRDAYNCGVSYGNFDIERLLRSMVVREDRIAFKESGVHAIEDYIFARYHMYWQVYLHPTANSYEIMLTKILRRVKELMLEDYAFKNEIDLLRPFINIDILTIQDYLALDESIVNYYFARFKEEDDEILSNLCSCFLNRRVFKHRDISSEKEAKGLIESVELNKEKQLYYFEIQIVKSSFYKYYGDLNTQSIIIEKRNKEITELYNVSNLVNAITDSAKEKQEMKLYYHQDYIGTLYEEN